MLNLYLVQDNAMNYTLVSDGEKGCIFDWDLSLREIEIIKEAFEDAGKDGPIFYNNSWENLDFLKENYFGWDCLA